MAVYIQLDRPRRLKLGFSALSHLKTKYGIKTINEIPTVLQSGDLSVVPMFIESCLIGDNEGLGDKSADQIVDEFLEKNTLEKLVEILKEVFEDSSLKDSKKNVIQKAKK